MKNLFHLFGNFCLSSVRTSVETNVLDKHDHTADASMKVFRARMNSVGQVYSHRVGGGVTSAVLPHHRTYGSVYGGSQSKLEASALFEQ
jgi:hypothetical protein